MDSPALVQALCTICCFQAWWADETGIVVAVTALVRVSHGLWRPPELAADTVERAASLLALCGPGAVISGFAAASFHGLWVEQPLSERLEVIVHPDQPLLERRSRNRRSEIRARRQYLAPDDVVDVCGLPMTNEAWTWLHLAGRLTPGDVVAAGDSVLRGGTSLDELSRVVRRAAGHRGVVKARAALDHLDVRSRSRPESLLRYAIVSAGLPRPQVNRAVYSPDGEWLAEPDLSYDDVRLALEYNGALHAETFRMRRDISRELDVESRGGWRVAVFGPAEVFRRPDQIPILVARLRQKQSRLLQLP